MFRTSSQLLKLLGQFEGCFTMVSEEVIRPQSVQDRCELGRVAEIAAQLDLTEEAIKKSVQRLRQRFRDCLRAEVAQTVATPDQIDDELRHLRAALSAGR